MVLPLKVNVPRPLVTRIRFIVCRYPSMPALNECRPFWKEMEPHSTLPLTTLMRPFASP